MKRSFLVSGILLSALFAMRCSSGDSTGDDLSNAGKAGSAGSGSSGRGGSSQGGSSGASSNCTPGETQACVGPGSCEGGQFCLTDGSGWGPCDCGDETGGTGGDGSGGGGNGGKGGDTSSGGNGGNTGGNGGSTGGNGGNGGSTGGNGGNGGSTGGNGGNGGSTGGISGASGAGTSGTAGAGGVSGAAGAGGAGAGAGGTAGAAGACTPPSNGLFKIPISPGMTPNTGWIDRASNCAGIQGNIYATADSMGSVVTVTQRNDDICFEGQTEQVVGSDFETYWGVRITIELNNDGMGGVDPYRAGTYGVDGFYWAVTGSLWRDTRPTLRVEGRATEYCVQRCGQGSSMLINEAHPVCSQGVSTTTPDPYRLTLLEVLIPATSQGDMAFDFCMEELSAITDNMSHSVPMTCPPANSASHCAGHCGETAPRPSNCYCDVDCTDFGDCCSDYLAECGDSCLGHCGLEAPNGCSCNYSCSFDDTGCCSDFESLCGI